MVLEEIWKGFVWLVEREERVSRSAVVDGGEGGDDIFCGVEVEYDIQG